MNQAFKLVVGSIVVYVTVAACSSGTNTVQNTASSGGFGNTTLEGSSGSMGTSNGSGGTLNGNGGGTSNTTKDAGVVPDAMAQAAGGAGPQVNTVACDTTITESGSTGLYAVMSYPGRTAAELAAVHAVGVLVAPTPTVTHMQVLARIIDGKVSVGCGLPANKTFSSVVFVLP